ncbi:mitochondrial distribution and morphology protein family 31/32 [Schizopora paradoxa]|uniref:Mitochondrial distribution and morphology protein family 31/32 n=1 Tax=Schizopora paradoxa TaxID=27342 RepID=A0A0H2RXU6_9AGAM|nr:mitochondrial distribution and morphology protein family 31/32 [Schizopora paradoxa]
MKSSNDQTVKTSSSTFQYAENYSKFFQRLARSLPPMQRPTREDFLNVANGFWQRMRVRFKWFTVRSFRKFNADDISAFFTWFLVSQTAWILLGTTTFFSVVFATINSLRMQERVARAISDYLTSETGVTIVFESAIVPKWKDSRIAFKNVYVSRRPPSQHKTAPVDQNAAHRAVASYDPSNHPAFYGLDEEYNRAPPPVEEDVDYSVFDLNIDSVDVTLSLTRWLDGKGLVQDAVIKGVRGILDRRYIHYDPENPWDPASFRHATQPGDFQLESLQLEDVLITVYQPGSFRPYTSSIFRADIKTFREQWMFYDFLSAENVVGQFDNCLFSLHKPQSIGRTTEQELQDGAWSRMSRVRIDGVNINHIQRASTMEGPIAWITSGKVDAVFDIRFPREADDHAIDELLGGIAEVITSVASNQAASLFERIPGQRELAKPAISAPEDPPVDPADAPRVVSIDIDLRFRDLKAAVPIFTSELSYVNSALIRPIVAFINANRTLVPIHCRVIKDISDFDGSWTMWETGLVDEIALKVYDALAYHVTVANFNRRVKTVSLWSLQKTASAALSTLQTIMTPMSAYLQELKG